jgi:non-canonical (house-cleaning) NTP pyrophosphatase
MLVAVGSLNPVKEAATERVPGDRLDATVELVDIDSGVSEQPMAHAVAGALGPFVTDLY